MRLITSMIFTAAVAALLMPTLLLRAAETEKPVANDDQASSAASQPTAMPYTNGMNRSVPRVELFVGYSYLRAMPASDDNRMVWLNGGSTSVAFNFNRYLGLVGDFGGFADSEVRLNLGNSTSVVDSTGHAYTYLFGPRVSFRNRTRLTPFVQALFGGMDASEVKLSNCSGGCTPLPAENKFAMTAGGGLDIGLSRHFAVRLIQAEYLMTSFENLSTAANARQNDMRLSSGIVFRFGANRERRMAEFAPLSYSCSVTPSTAYLGDAIAVSGTALNLNPAKMAAYTWSADGGTVVGTSSTARIDTANLAAGAYTLKGHVSEGDRPSENADCTAPYVLKAYEPPTVSCSASPVTVLSGDSSTITATGISPQNRPLTYSFSATSGSVNGTGSTAILSTTGAAIGPVTVTCNVVDDKGQTASAATTVAVEALPVAPKPMISELCSLHFDRDPRRPSRVDNEGKACLDQVALNLQQEPDAKLALVGNAAGSEKGGRKLAAERAANTRVYLVKEKGIDSSRIAVYSGSQDGKMVTTTLIPADATFDATGDTLIP